MNVVERGESVLVTGATGFLGSWLTNALVDAGADVVCLVRDANPGSNFERLGLARRVRIVQGSLTDLPTVERMLNEYEVRTVVHLAAQTQVGVANRAPLSTYRANVEGTWNLLEACRQLPRVERVVVASSDKAYGAHKTLPYVEDAPLLAKHPYDASKAMTEILCRTYFHTYGTPVAVTRCGNIYGGGDTNFQRIVPDTARALHEGRNPVILSDGSPVRDYIHVDDVVGAYLAVLAHWPQAKGETFNFGTGSPVSVLTLVERMVALSSRPDLKPDVRARGRTTGEIDQQYLSNEKAIRVLGWKPRVSLDEGLRSALTWYADYLSGGMA